MKTLYCWPSRLPSSLDGLYEQVASQAGFDVVQCLDALSEVTAVRALQEESGATDALASDALVAVIDAAVLSEMVSPADVIEGLQAVAGQSVLDLVVVVGDGYLSTDIADLGPTMLAASAVAAARALAVRRGSQRRANVVCIPDAMFGRASTQRGALLQQVECVDVTNAVAFLLGAGASYLSGQVLFVDGGRQLFSSHSA